MRSRFIAPLALLSFFAPLCHAAGQLPGTAPLAREGDFSEQMVAGIQKFLLRETENSVAARAQFWKRDLSSPEALAKSVEPNRQRLAQILGVVDKRISFKALEHIASTRDSAVVADTPGYTVFAVYHVSQPEASVPTDRRTR